MRNSSPASLSKSLLKYGVSCFNPQRLPTPCYLCRLGFFPTHKKEARKHRLQLLHTLAFPKSLEVLMGQTSRSVDSPLTCLDGRRRNWQVNANPSTAQSRCSCSAAFCGLFNALFPKWIKALSVSPVQVLMSTCPMITGLICFPRQTSPRVRTFENL